MPDGIHLISKSGLKGICSQAYPHTVTSLYWELLPLDQSYAELYARKHNFIVPFS